MDTYLAEYVNYLKDVKKLSKSTCEAYLSDVEKLTQYFDTIGINSIDTVRNSDLAKYINNLKSVSMSDSTVNRSISAIKSYFGFLLKSGFVAENSAEKLKPLSTDNSNPEILDREEVIKLIEAPVGNTVKAKRDRAMLELLYATGMKVSEIIELLPENVNLQFNFIKIANQKHERTVPIYPEAARHLSEYINIYRPAIADQSTEFLFTNIKGQPLSRQGLWKIIKQYADKAGINKTITPHTLRHSFAVHLLENGADINDIKEMMGHADISSTMFYTNMIKQKFNRGYAKYHPLAK